MKASVKVSLLCAGVSIALALAATLWGTLFSIAGNELGYALLCYFIGLPLLSMMTGLILGLKRAAWRWLYVPLTGLLGALMSIPLFAMWTIVPFMGMIPAAMGLLVGHLFAPTRGKEAPPREAEEGEEKEEGGEPKA